MSKFLWQVKKRLVFHGNFIYSAESHWSFMEKWTSLYSSSTVWRHSTVHAQMWPYFIIHLWKSRCLWKEIGKKLMVLSHFPLKCSCSLWTRSSNSVSRHHTPACALNQVSSLKSVSLWKKHPLKSWAAVARSVHQRTLHFNHPGASRSSVLRRRRNHADYF